MASTTSIDEIAALRRAFPGTRFVDVLLADLCGIPRGKRVTIDELAQVYDGGFLLPGSMFAIDVLGATIQETHLGFDEGDADRPCLPIPGTLLRMPWSQEDAAQIQVSMHEHDGSPFHGDPRHVLASVLQKFQALGLQPVVAIELEFYFVDVERTEDGRIRPPRLPQTGRREYRTQINSMSDLNEFAAVLADISAACATQRIPAGTALAEYGPGQFEVNLSHSADVLGACDEAIRFKRLVRGVATRHGMEATFMPKPYADMAGSGAHLHVSVLDAEGHNIFESADPAGSVRLKRAIGGLKETMADANARLRAHHQFLSALSIRILCAPESDLGREQSRRRSAHSCELTRVSSHRASRRRRRRESVPADGSRARRHPSRTDSLQRSGSRTDR